MRAILFFILVLITPYSHSQEICNNGIDDDGDGFIDLLDDECQSCGENEIFTIPNPSFENPNCCPPIGSSQVNSPDSIYCSSNWLSNNFVADIGSCDSPDIASLQINNPSATPFPNGDFIIGLEVIQSNLTYTSTFPFRGPNSFGTCLTDSLYSYKKYKLSLSSIVYYSSSITNIPAPTSIQLYLKNNCNNVAPGFITTPGVNCISNDWTFSDSADAIPTAIWQTNSFEFQPQQNSSALAIQGGSCYCPTSITNFALYYIGIDDLHLYEIPAWDTVGITQIGACDPTINELHAWTDTVGGTWQWFKDSVALVGETDSILMTDNYGTGYFTAMYYLGGLCKGFTYFLPTDYFPYPSINTQNVCFGDTVNFDGEAFVAGGQSIDSINWQFGNGQLGFSEDTIFYYNQPGQYNVDFIAITNQGCIDTASTIVEVYESPIVDFSINGNCLVEGSIFTDLTSIAGSSSIDSIHWQFGDNTFGVDSIENHIYNNIGIYSIQLFVQSDQGCADSLVQTIFVNANPIADFSITDTCVFQVVNLNNNSNIASGTITNYEWDFGDNSNSTLFEPNHPFNQAGDYDLQLVAISDSACTDTSTFNLTIHPQPVADFTFSASCFNASFLDASNISSGSINDYAWDFGDMNTASIQNPNHVYTANGNYTVSLQTTSDFGCVHDTSKSITIFNNFTADFVASTTQICSGDCIQFSDSSTVHTSGTYTWAFSDGQTSNLKNPLMCFQNSDEVSLGIDVKYKVETHSGCVDSITYTNYIQVFPRPTAYFTYTPEDPSISNPYLVFQNQSTNAGSYTWNFGDNETSAVVSPSHVYPEIAKEYSVVLTAYDQSANCHDTYQTTISIADEILFFIPNAFSPNSGSINNTFQPQFTSGVDIYNFRMQLFNRWGGIVFETQDPNIGWDGQYQNQFVTQGAYVWKIDFNETMSDKKHIYSGYVTVVR